MIKLILFGLCFLSLNVFAGPREEYEQLAQSKYSSEVYDALKAAISAKGIDSSRMNFDKPKNVTINLGRSDSYHTVIFYASDSDNACEILTDDNLKPSTTTCLAKPK